jgi:hypothetical protein
MVRSAVLVAVAALVLTGCWTGDFEEGNLSDLTLNGGGGEFNSGSGDTTASTVRAHTGNWSAAARLATANGGTRLFRWNETRANREFVASAWLYLPGNVTSRGNFWNLMQIKSRSTTGLNEPIWQADVTLVGGNYRLDMIWYGNRNAPPIYGPFAGMTQGWKRYTYLTLPEAAPNGQVNLPKDQWFRLRFEVRQSRDFDGALRVRVGDTVAYDFQNVRTSYDNCAYNAWCTSNEWSVNNYSDGLQPAPVTVGIDDVQIATP